MKLHDELLRVSLRMKAAERDLGKARETIASLEARLTACSEDARNAQREIEELKAMIRAMKQVTEHLFDE